MSIKLSEQSAVATSGTSLGEFETYCGLAASDQRAVLWWIGDLALAVERQYPETHNQAWPVWVSPDLIDRCKAVSAAYPPGDRNIEANWTLHMQSSKKPDRVAIVAAHVEAGHTSDEARKTPVTHADEPKPETAAGSDVMTPPRPAQEPGESDSTNDSQAPNSDTAATGWLLAVDVNYFVHSYFHSGAGVEAASTFDQWLGRLLDRLQRDKGLTDCVCCLDGRDNHRKKLTEGWESPYKPRVDKEQELAAQLNRAPELLKSRGLACVVIDEMEADDVMASYAKQFTGRVTLLTKDKDMRQCLGPKCNMLTDVEWEQNTETGDHLPVYKWVSAKQHTEEGLTYGSTKVSGITPEQWPHFQAIAGDSSDGIKGCEGIGGKGAMDLIKEHGTVQGVIAAAKSGVIALTAKKLQAVLDFEPVSETMLKLTTLRNDLKVPFVTRLSLKEL